MNASFYLEDPARIDLQNLIEETAEVLILLAYTMAIIAQPGTAPLFGKVLAVMAQHTATNWAALLTTDIPVVKEVV